MLAPLTCSRLQQAYTSALCKIKGNTNAWQLSVFVSNQTSKANMQALALSVITS
jgi:hypothetical protein